MAVEKGTNSFCTVAEADAWFADRLGADRWTAASAGTKGAALVTAWRDLATCGRYAFPSAIADAMISGQCEQALFLVAYNADAEVRAAVREMGVAEAALVGETYAPTARGIIIAPRAHYALAGYQVQGGSAGAATIVIVRSEPEE